MDWLDWSTDAFARARAERRPVLLYLSAPWSSGCRRLDRELWSEPGVRERVEREWVAVRVDADRRPDIAERYTLGGWPTLAFLGADGELLGGGVDLDRARVLRALERLPRVYASGAVPPGAAGADSPGGRDADGPPMPWRELPEAVLAHALAGAAEDVAGGLPCPPCPVLLDFLIDDWRLSGDPHVGHLVTSILDGMAAGGLRDLASGGFFRAATAPGWSNPDPALLLDVNAALVTVYARAAVLGHDRFREVALGAIAFVEGTLRAGRRAACRASAWRDELGPGDAAGEFALPFRVDPSVYADGNARFAHALLHAAAAFDDGEFAARAVDVLEDVVPAAYDRGAGVAHCLAPVPGVRGLLGDQVAVAAALADAGAATGRTAYRDLAEELARSALRRFRVPGVPGLVDRVRTRAGAGAVGRLGEPFVPVGLNAELALVLARLAATAGEGAAGELAAEARGLLDTLDAAWRHAMLEDQAAGARAVRALQELDAA